MDTAALLLVGAFGGILSALVGIGGGIVITPALVLLLGYSQKLAQGTTLAMLLPPIGAVAVLGYYRQGNVNLPAAFVLCAGFLAGSALGVQMAGAVDNETLKKAFGVLLMALGVRMFF